MESKLWGMRGARPVDPSGRGAPAPDAMSALQNFDGISYARARRSCANHRPHR